MSEQEWEEKLAEVQKESESWYNKYKDAEKRIVKLEDKIADLKANCDLAIEGRDVKIKELELELTVEKDLHQEETNLHLHAEEYIKSLEEENAELKEKLKPENCLKLLAKEGYIKFTSEQLTKATDLIENIIRVTWGEGWNYSLDWKVKAEQFLEKVK